MKLSRRSTLLGLGLGLGAAALAPGLVHARAKLAYDLEPIAIADGLWMVEGANEHFTDENGGAILNVVLARTPKGMAIIDTGPSRRYGEALRQLALALDPRGLVATVNTHHHPDHFLGNQVFADRPIHGLPGTIALAKEEGDGFTDNLYRILGDWMRGTEAVAPTQPVVSSTLDLGGRVFTTYPLEGHTGADLALLDRQTGTLIAGDLAFLDRAPTTPHADLAKWRASIDTLLQVEAALVVPGHGPAEASNRALTQTRDYLDWLEARLRRDALAGLDMVEIMESPIDPPWDALAVQPAEFRRSVSHLFPAIEREVLPVTNG